MTGHEIEHYFESGLKVYYQGDDWYVIGANMINQTYTLERVTDKHHEPNIKPDEVTSVD